MQLKSMYHRLNMLLLNRNWSKFDNLIQYNPLHIDKYKTNFFQDKWLHLSTVQNHMHLMDFDRMYLWNLVNIDI